MSRKILFNKSSTHLAAQSTHREQNPQYQRLGGAKPYVTGTRLKVNAVRKYEDKETLFHGITVKDCYTGKYKVVETKKEAENLIHNHIRDGNLFPKEPVSRPQQYFASRDMAQTSASIQEYRNRTLIPHPTGGTNKKGYFVRRDRRSLFQIKHSDIDSSTSRWLSRLP